MHVVLEGCYHESTAAGERLFSSGSALWKPAGMRHENHFPSIGARTLRIEIQSHRNTELCRILQNPGYCAVNPGIELLARRLCCEIAARDDLCALAGEGLCLELLALLGRVQVPVVPHRSAEACADLLRARSSDAGLRLGDLATELGCDRSGLARAFRVRFHCSMSHYVRVLRVTNVMRLLDEGQAPLVQIALLAGFADQSHCTRVFRAVVGSTPGAWARSTRVPGVHTGSRRGRDMQ
jgi:AraC-like DNA-binding protein